jgi:CRISPR/Cas system Type II protein with McrA/HNH and RuvC-like nuclease domain
MAKKNWHNSKNELNESLLKKYDWHTKIQDRIASDQKRKHALKKKLIELYGSQCCYCDRPFSYKELSLDHIYPQAEGGNKWSIGNTILACKPCNYIKGRRVVSIEEFRKEIMGDRYVELTYQIPGTPAPKKGRYAKKREKYPMAKVPGPAEIEIIKKADIVTRLKQAVQSALQVIVPPRV